MIRMRNGRMTLVLCNRQLVMGIALLMTLMWMFAVVTFLVARVAFPGSVSAEQPPMERLPRPKPKASDPDRGFQSCGRS